MKLLPRWSILLGTSPILIRVISVSCAGGAAGRIEICVGGEWRAVCADDAWGIRDATTVCRQLGFRDINIQVKV